jgi:hypothetical protein
LATHAHPTSDAAGEVTKLDAAVSSRVPIIALFVGVSGIVLSLLLSPMMGGGFRRFWFAYLIGFCFFFSISVAALLFVMVQHLVHAAWSVNVRRVAEAMACNLPVIGVLSLPIVLSVLIGGGQLYRWAWWVDGPVAHHAGHSDHVPGDATPHNNETHAAPASQANELGQGGHGGDVITGEKADVSDVQYHPSTEKVPEPDELTWHKRPFLNPTFFTLRVAFYFLFFTGVAFWYWKHSTAQDADGDYSHTAAVQGKAAPLILLTFLFMTFAAFDFIMSLDPHWYSTMYGVYFFAGGIVSFFAALILTLKALQKFGYLTKSVTTEHYHDLGKFTFGFTFFWGYIAFSQYMLLWYASLPETVMWLTHRGATTRTPDLDYYWGWTVVAILLLLAQFALPFAGLMSRHVKRHPVALPFWAGWILFAHFIDLWWQIGPELDGKWRFPLPEILAVIGVGGVFVAALVWRLGRAQLRPVHDPRVAESLAFQNM